MMAMSQPWAARDNAICRPRSLPPPVTTAISPASDFIICVSCPLSSSVEARFLDSLDAQALDGEDRAIEASVLREARNAHRGHEEGIERGAAEHHAGQLEDRKFDPPIDRAVRRKSANLPDAGARR